MSSNAVSPTDGSPVKTVDATLFRAACGRFATGITIVTVMGEDGQPHGMTVNSFTSVSLDPPLVLVCIDRKATILPKLEAAERIGINVLSEGQKDLSSQFARRGTDRFESVEWFPGELGVPLFEGTLSSFECLVTGIAEGGDHRVFIAEVKHARCLDGRPLLYFASGYQKLP